MAKIDRYTQNIPKLYKPGINPVITALLKAWAQEDDQIVQQIKNAKAQLFVKTASGKNLDKLASGLGVSRDQDLQLIDTTFRELIPNLSLKPKQIRKTLYETLEVFWGPLFSHANVTSNNVAPFDVSEGDEIQVKIDNGDIQTITVKSGDIETDGSATADEMAEILSRIEGATVSIITNSPGDTESINIRTNTVGLRGSVTILASSMIDSTKLDLTTKEWIISDLDQRVCIYEIRNKELVIELPAIVPILKSTLKGSHHFHADAALEGDWKGGFLFSRTGTSYNVTGKSAEIQDTLEAGQVYTQLTVDDASEIPDGAGYLIFDFGLETQEQPVKYIGRPNDQTILLDPAHVFTKTHTSGGKINLLSSVTPAVPRTDGSDLAVYLTSPSAARAAVQSLLQALVAAGVVVNFVILLPEYYTDITPNPYA